MISKSIKFTVLIAFGIVAGLLFLNPAPALAAAAHPLPDPSIDAPHASGDQTVVFAGGCFWCTEAVFEQFAGVKKVVPGYAGGTKDTAHYEMVGSGSTTHAESVQVTFDPSRITYGQLLKIFFSVVHDPTQLNRQGPDWGKQYRSAIFYANADQKRVAEAYIKQLDDAKAFDKPIVTQLTELKGFYPAEEYHHHFVERHPTHPYVVANAIPKIQKARKAYPDLVKKS